MMLKKIVYGAEATTTLAQAVSTDETCDHNWQRMFDLAERVEEVTGPDEVVDQEIAAAAEWEHRSGAEWQHVLAWERPRYTASLDAVMTLEPEGLESEEIYPPDDECPVWTSHVVIRGNLHSGTGNTRVLAQLASRLRARAESQS